MPRYVVNRDFENQIKGRLEEAGLNVVKEGSSHRFLSRLGGTSPQPDFVIKEGGRQVFLEAKARPMLSDVLQSGQYISSGKGTVVFCTPENNYTSIPNSVRTYAEKMGVVLCHVGEVGHVVRGLMVK